MNNHWIRRLLGWPININVKRRAILITPYNSDWIIQTSNTMNNSNKIHWIKCWFRCVRCQIEYYTIIPLYVINPGFCPKCGAGGELLRSVSNLQEFRIPISNRFKHFLNQNRFEFFIYESGWISRWCLEEQLGRRSENWFSRFRRKIQFSYVLKKINSPNTQIEEE